MSQQRTLIIYAMTGEGTYHKIVTVLGINKDAASIDITTVKGKVTYRESNSYVKNAVALVSNTVSACLLFRNQNSTNYNCC